MRRPAIRHLQDRRTERRLYPRALGPAPAGDAERGEAASGGRPVGHDRGAGADPGPTVSRVAADRAA